MTTAESDSPSFAPNISVTLFNDRVDLHLLFHNGMIERKQAIP